MITPLMQIIQESDSTWSCVDYETQTYYGHMSGSKDLNSAIAACLVYVPRDRIQICPRDNINKITIANFT